MAMEQRALGQQGLQVPALGLGGMGMSEPRALGGGAGHTSLGYNAGSTPTKAISCLPKIVITMPLSGR